MAKLILEVSTEYGREDSLLRVSKDSDGDITIELYHHKLGKVYCCYIRSDNIAKFKDFLGIEDNICKECQKKLCTNCKTQLQNDSKFCPECGGRV